jgi:site-specific DNA-methyltransferase (adenine-specific)
MDCQVLHGDSLDILRTLPDASVDAVITDPPYSSGGMMRSDRMGSTTKKYVQTQVVRNGLTKHADFSGDNRDQRAYGYWCSLWLSECLRIARPGSPILVFTDWRQLPTTTDVLQSGGWVWRGIAVWDKTEAARSIYGRFRNQCEYIVWGSQGAMAMNDGRPAYPGVYREFVRQKDKHHITGKPTNLMRQLLQIVPPGGVILDPFAGSGTTGIAAVQEGRKAILIEREAGYVAIIHDRLAQLAPRDEEQRSA